MKTWTVEVSWTMIGAYTIQADTEEEVREKANDLPLPDGTYLDSSFVIDEVREETE